MLALLQGAASKNCPWARILSEAQEERNLEISGPQVGSAINFTWQVKQGVWIRALVEEIISTCAVPTCFSNSSFLALWSIQEYACGKRTIEQNPLEAFLSQIQSFGCKIMCPKEGFDSTYHM